MSEPTESGKSEPAKSSSKNFSVMLSSLKMALATFSSRILGLVREQAMAAYFGASGVTDAFLVAYRIPNLLRDLFAEGAFSAAFVPIFTEAKQKSLEEAREVLWSSALVLAAITGLLSTIIFVFAPEFVGIFAPSFEQVPEKFQLTVNLTRWMAPFLFFVSLAALFMGVLNSLKIFFIPSFAPAFFNIAMITCIFLLTDVLSGNGYPGVYSLGIGVFIGGVCQVLLQLPLVLKNKLGPKWPKEVFNKPTKKILIKLGPGLIGFAATQINLIVNTLLATGTVVGAVSWLSYGFRLFQFPVGILSVSIAGSNLVHFSEAWKKDDQELAKKYLKFSYDLSLLLIIPAMALMYAQSMPMANLIFERGKWQFIDTVNTSHVLKLYILGLPFYGLYKILVPTFYTVDKQKIPVYCSIVAISLNIAFCLLMVPAYGYRVLALGTTLSMLVNSGAQAFIIKKFLNLPLNFFFDKKFFKIFISGYLAYLVADIMTMAFYEVSAPFMTKVLQFLAASFAGLGTYCLILLIFGEGKTLKSFLRRRK